MQNDMRDRLIKLLQNTPTDYEGNKGVGTIADHLIANGVILLTCDVGDKLYGFEYPRRDIVVINEETVEDVNIEIETNEGWYDFREIGTRVFLTKDQAEQKLKEMRVKNG